jgi:NAD(P)H dehydrogenase (quinone)
MILVTGASGQLGGQTVEFLLDRVPATEVAVLARDPAAVAGLADRGVDVRQGDYADPASLERAFAGVDKLLLVSTTAFSDAVSHHRNVIAAAVDAGVRHLHYTSIQRGADSTFAISQVTDWDRATEAALAASGLAVTLLRNPLYLDVLPAIFGADVGDGPLRLPAGTGAAALATRSDLAEATAAVLAGSGHEGRTYTLTATEAMTMAEIAAVIGAATGTEIAYEDHGVDAFVAARVATGMPEPAARFLAEWVVAFGVGEFAAVTADLPRLLGRDPVSPREFLQQCYRPLSADRAS